ncbi:unnamed protein product [Mytilus coruscus]|uniref:Uncharacterized protein n=1 Tax=Mytilus coruscus TaxID=42192 RepID=A0A6J8DXP1_MYTCO|nr:unnamed protein product [Mytilus coruscus]
MTEDFDDKKPIAIFKPEKAAKLHSSGEYLSGRVTLTNITSTSNTAALKFLILRCIDEKDYICKYYVINMDGDVSTARSETTRILVKGKNTSMSKMFKLALSQLELQNMSTFNPSDTFGIATDKNFQKERQSIHSEVSYDQEEISEDNDYEEIGSISYHEVNLSNDRIETSHEPMAEGEIVSENIPISACSSSSGNNITMIHFYVNTNISNTNERIKMSADNETVSNHLNELGNDNIDTDDTFVYDYSESDTHQVHQYVNMTSPRVLNIYQDLNHTTTDPHKYECLNTEGSTTFTD